MNIKEKKLILQGIEIAKEYIKGNFKTIYFFLDLEGWDVIELVIENVLVDNFIDICHPLTNLLNNAKEEN